MIKKITKKMVETVKKIDPVRVYEIVKENPNNMVLGEEIRRYINELEKTR